MIKLVLILTASDSTRDELKTALIDIAEKTKNEAGCIDYKIIQSSDNKNEFLLFENWKDQNAFEQHLEMDYIKNLMKKLPNLIIKEPLRFKGEEISVNCNNITKN